ncbi:myo-inosose-2 dehydratase [Inquilinus sp. CAU 1745]|uniref:myo-inosose-2 dehydratase n=1 Tax=Inquilinus sp. CAU 1745 TaxID=3140369 RepID=UPI00325B29D7
MSVRIGANPIGWSNDDMPELGGETPLETCLAEAAAAGFEGMELGNKFPREPEALRAILSKHGMSLVSGWYSANLLDRDDKAEMEVLRPHLDLLKALGSDVLVFAETTGCVHGDRATPLSNRPKLDAGQWREFGARMTRLADATAAEGVRLAYHHHMGTVVESEVDIDALMAATGPSVGLLLDSGHATFAGIDPAALARRYRDRIAHVHTKDIRPAVMARAKAEGWSFLDAVIEGVFTVPGDGGIDFPAMFAELRGYEGWVVVEAEQDPAKAHPATYARLGFDNLNRYLTEAGLR